MGQFSKILLAIDSADTILPGLQTRLWLVKPGYGPNHSIPSVYSICGKYISAMYNTFHELKYCVNVTCTMIMMLLQLRPIKYILYNL